MDPHPTPSPTPATPNRQSFTGMASLPASPQVQLVNQPGSIPPPPPGTTVVRRVFDVPRRLIHGEGEPLQEPSEPLTAPQETKVNMDYVPAMRLCAMLGGEPEIDQHPDGMYYVSDCHFPSGSTSTQGLRILPHVNLEDFPALSTKAKFAIIQTFQNSQRQQLQNV